MHSAKGLRSLTGARRFERRVRSGRRRHRHRQMTTGGAPYIDKATCVPGPHRGKAAAGTPEYSKLAPPGRCPLGAGVHPLRYVDVDSAQQKAPSSFGNRSRVGRCQTSSLQAVPVCCLLHCCASTGCGCTVAHRLSLTMTLPYAHAFCTVACQQVEVPDPAYMRRSASCCGISNGTA